MSKSLADYVHFSDRALENKWANRRIPMSTVYEAYMAGSIDIPDEHWDKFWTDRYDLTSFTLTGEHIKWAFTNFIPEVMIHSTDQDSHVVGDNYNRGNDFYNWFLGEAMVYTSAWYDSPTTSLEHAQYAKIDRCCDKMRLQPGESLLDIGCGWGTFVARAAQKYGAKTHGVTLASEQVEFGMDRIKQYGVSDRALVEVRDYRNINGTFNKIVSLEMVEHVGIKNLNLYFEKVHQLLDENGIFVLQWTGIRNLYSPRNPLSAITMGPEDLIWGLFMNRYIFPGADASVPLSSMLRAAENAGFEIEDVERMSAYYVMTLKAWRQNWLKNREPVVKKYGERLFRLWNFFLHWSAVIGEQGSAFTYQVTMHKNANSFDRMGLAFPSTPKPGSS